MIEVLARGVAIGALTALGAGLWTGGAGQPVRLAGALFCIGVIAYTINSSPQLRHAAGWTLPLFHFFALGGTGLFWLFIVALFEDRPVSALTLAPTLLLTGIGVLGIAATGPPQQGVWVFHNMVEAALSGHALYVVVRSWRGDLVEARRRLRGPFLAVVTLYVITLSGFEIAEILGQDAPWHRLLGGVSLAVYCLAGAIVFLQARTELFGAARLPPAQADGLDAGDRATLERLNGLMEAGAWRREGLTIGELAEQAGVPEHRLRRLINDHLGFRNFAAFVNARRIEAAKTLLADPAQARVSVATIAFDLGFGSLGPFNRAFKDVAGLTPTQWRRRALSPNSENPG